MILWNNIIFDALRVWPHIFGLEEHINYLALGMLEDVVPTQNSSQGYRGSGNWKDKPEFYHLDSSADIIGIVARKCATN